MQENEFGWNPELEAQHAAAIQAMTVSPPCEAASGDIPETMDPDWFLQDLQGPWPFCHAHMRTGMEEILAWLATHQVFQFSRKLAAVLDMRMDGNDSRPAGASISGSIRAGQKWGTCLEKDWPYYATNQDAYTNKIPAAVMEKAGHFHITTVSPSIRTYQDLDRWNTSGRAVIGFGMDWTTGCDALTDKAQAAAIPRGAYRGGHALLVFGWRTVKGERWPIVHNSQSNRWGVRRRCAWSPAIWNAVLSQSRFGAFAATNISMDDPAPMAQPWGWVQDAYFTSTGRIDLKFGGAV